jgi:hypothetical protein
MGGEVTVAGALPDIRIATWTDRLLLRGRVALARVLHRGIHHGGLALLGLGRRQNAPGGRRPASKHRENVHRATSRRIIGG